MGGVWSGFHGLDAAHDFGQFGGDLALACAVVLHGEGLEHFVGVIGRALHGDHACDIFAGGGVEEALEEGGFDCEGEQFVEQLVR